MASMFDTIADMLRGSAPDDLAHALGTDRTQTRRAMEIGLPALITGLRDKTLEPGGAQNLASMLDESSASVPSDLEAYLSAGDPSRGAAMLDVAFGDRGEPALAALSSASGLSTRLLAQVMSVLAPLATGTVANAAERSPDGLRSYLGAAVADLEGKGFGRVVDLVSPAGLDDVLHTDIAHDEVALDEPVEDAGDIVPIVGHGDPELVDADEIMIDIDADYDATVVEGAFPDADGLLEVDEFDELDQLAPVELDQLDPIDIDESTEALDMGGSMSSFDTEVASVAPAGVTIAGDMNVGADLPAPTVALADADLDTGLDTGLAVDPELDLEGDGLSGLGWLWWLLGAVLGLAILLFAISQCGGSDGADTDLTAGTDTTSTPAAEPTTDPEVAQRQATLDSILVAYPGVTGEVFGDVAVLNGTVADDTERALLDQAVRAAGLGAQNNVTASQAPAAGAEGYSLNDLIDAQPELSTLRALLDQAGLGTALDSGADFTLFAPTNDAFAAVSDQIAELQSDPQALQDVLRYHLLVGAQDAAMISASTSLPTQLDGQSIDVSANGGSIVLNGSVPVLVGDAEARNGKMHIISGVLLPQTAVVLPEEIGAELGLAPITFALGSADLTDAGRVELDKVVTFLLATPGNIEIGGHTDSDGEPGFNLTLSQDRANAVKSYLSENGIPAESMSAVGFGEDQPVAPNDTQENKARNRRIEFRPN